MAGLVGTLAPDHTSEAWIPDHAPLNFMLTNVSLRKRLSTVELLAASDGVVDSDVDFEDGRLGWVDGLDF
nr:unnamed protein product [Haemonchus contortus]